MLLSLFASLVLFLRATAADTYSNPDGTLIDEAKELYSLYFRTLADDISAIPKNDETRLFLKKCVHAAIDFPEKSLEERYSYCQNHSNSIENGGALSRQIVISARGLLPLLDELDIPERDFPLMFGETFNSEKFETCCKTERLKQKLFWEALKPGTDGTTMMSSQLPDIKSYNLNEQDAKELVAKLIREIDALNGRMYTHHAYCISLYEAFNYENDEERRAELIDDHLKKFHVFNTHEERVSHISDALRLANVFQKYAKKMRNMHFDLGLGRALELSQDLDYKEIANEQFKATHVLRKFFGVLSEENKVDLLNELTDNAYDWYSLISQNETLSIWARNVEKMMEQDETTNFEKLRYVRSELSKGYMNPKSLENVFRPFENFAPEYSKANIHSKATGLLFRTAFREASDRMRRKLLWTAISGYKKPRKTSHERIYKENLVSSEILEGLELTGKYDKERIQIVQNYLRIAFDQNKESEARRWEELSQAMRSHQLPEAKIPGMVDYHKRMRAALFEKFHTAGLNPIEAMYNWLELDINPDFRELGRTTRRKILNEVINPEHSYTPELVSNAVEDEIYRLAGV